MHSDVGGGYPESRAGLAKNALLWMVQAARTEGLRVDRGGFQRVVMGLGSSFTPPSCGDVQHEQLEKWWHLAELLPRRKANGRWGRPRPGAPRHLPGCFVVHKSVIDRMLLSAAQRDGRTAIPYLPSSMTMLDSESARRHAEKVSGGRPVLIKSATTLLVPLPQGGGDVAVVRLTPSQYDALAAAEASGALSDPPTALTTLVEVTTRRLRSCQPAASIFSELAHRLEQATSSELRFAADVQPALQRVLGAVASVGEGAEPKATLDDESKELRAAFRAGRSFALWLGKLEGCVENRQDDDETMREARAALGTMLAPLSEIRARLAANSDVDGAAGALEELFESFAATREAAESATAAAEAALSAVDTTGQPPEEVHALQLRAGLEATSGFELGRAVLGSLALNEEDVETALERIGRALRLVKTLGEHPTLRVAAIAHRLVPDEETKTALDAIARSRALLASNDDFDRVPDVFSRSPLTQRDFESLTRKLTAWENRAPLTEEDASSLRETAGNAIDAIIEAATRRVVRIEIHRDALDTEDVVEFVKAHLAEMKDITPDGSVYAFEVDALRGSEVRFFVARFAGDLVGCGALHRLEADRVEVKAMRTQPERRGEGIATQLLSFLLQEASRLGYREVLLETGAGSEFRRARSLYEKNGFTYRGRFGDYPDDPNSVFMSRKA